MFCFDKNPYFLNHELRKSFFVSNSQSNTSAQFQGTEIKWCNAYKPTAKHQHGTFFDLFESIPRSGSDHQGTAASQDHEQAMMVARVKQTHLELGLTIRKELLVTFEPTGEHENFDLEIQSLKQQFLAHQLTLRQQKVDLSKEIYQKSLPQLISRAEMVRDGKIPDFWLNAIKYCADCHVKLTKFDQQVLRYVDDIDMTIDRHGVHELLSYSFKMAPNPFMITRHLTLAFTIDLRNDSISAQGCDIEWRDKYADQVTQTCFLYNFQLTPEIAIDDLFLELCTAMQTSLIPFASTWFLECGGTDSDETSDDEEEEEMIQPPPQLNDSKEVSGFSSNCIGFTVAIIFVSQLVYVYQMFIHK